jgi:hypothetical protein
VGSGQGRDEKVLMFNYAPVFHVFCRNATNAIKINHIMVPKTIFLYINFTPSYLPALLKPSPFLNQYELMEAE